MSKCDSSARVRRVSSQAIRSTSRSTRSARAETSCRLPMGVATTKSVPRALRLRGLFVGLGDQHRPLVVQDHLARDDALLEPLDRKSTRLNSSHVEISYAVFCLKKKKKNYKKFFIYKKKKKNKIYL